PDLHDRAVWIALQSSLHAHCRQEPPRGGGAPDGAVVPRFEHPDRGTCLGYGRNGCCHSYSSRRVADSHGHKIWGYGSHAQNHAGPRGPVLKGPHLNLIRFLATWNSLMFL